MKRILALILVMILAACGTISAFAEEGSAGQQPQEGSGFMDDATPPEPPEGGMPDGPGGMGTPPDKPDGDMPGNGGFGGGTPPGGMTSSFEYAAATEITEAMELTDQTYASETADESALIVSAQITGAPSMSPNFP